MTKHIVLAAGADHGRRHLLLFAEDDFEFISGPGVLLGAVPVSERRFVPEKLTHPREFLFQVQGLDAVFTTETAAGGPLRDIGFVCGWGDPDRGRHVSRIASGDGRRTGLRDPGPHGRGPEVYEAIMRWPSVRHPAARRPDEDGQSRGSMLSDTFRRLHSAMYGPDEREFALTFSENAREVYRATDGSYEYADISELYRSPAELGWKKNIKFDHEFIGRAGWRQICYGASYDRDARLECGRRHRRLCIDVPGIRITRSWRCAERSDCLFADRVIGCRRRDGQESALRDVTAILPRNAVAVRDRPAPRRAGNGCLRCGASRQPRRRSRPKVAPAPYKRDNRRADVSALAAARA